MGGFIRVFFAAGRNAVGVILKCFALQQPKALSIWGYPHRVFDNG
jgi:hypothetical protein